MNKKHWTKDEKEFVFNNLGKLSSAEIGKSIRKTEKAVNIFLCRNRRSPRTKVKDNIILRLVKLAFNDHPEYFTPTREFFTAVKIGQKRWWALYKGIVPPTDEEILRVQDHFSIMPGLIFESLQLTLFDENE